MAFKGWFGFTTLRLDNVQELNHNTKRLRFALPDTKSLTGLSLTSALLTFHWPSGSLFPVVRPYTPINNLDDPGYIDLLVKKYAGGKTSTHLHALKPGDTVMFGNNPVKGYAWKSNEADQVNLIAGGSGITPIYQLIQQILGDSNEKTKMRLIFAANSDADLVLKAELDAFKKKFPDRLSVIYTVSNPIEGSSLPKGYVTKEFLERHLVPFSKSTDKIFVCGPPLMEASIVGVNGYFSHQKGILEELGYSRNQIVTF